MPKAKITAETVEVLKQAEAAANDPEPVQPSDEPITTPITETPPEDKDQKFIDELADSMAEIDRKLSVAEDHVSTIKAQKKEIREQWLDAIKNKPTLYKKLLQEAFNF